MGTFRHRAPAALPADDVFEFVADVGNLPRDFPRMTPVEPANDERPVLANGTSGPRGADDEPVRAKAWLLVDEPARSLRWGAGGPDDHRGSLRVREAGSGECEIEVEVCTATDDGARVEEGLRRTVALIARSAAAHDG